MRRRDVQIAVTDDERELRQYFLKVLTHLGYNVIAVLQDGEELVRYCAQAIPDLIISDVQLPGISGPDAVAAIRIRNWVAAIYVTENASEDEAALAARQAVVLPKPFRMSDLQPAIELALTIPPTEHKASIRTSPAEVKHDGSS